MCSTENKELYIYNKICRDIRDINVIMSLVTSIFYFLFFLIVLIFLSVIVRNDDLIRIASVNCQGLATSSKRQDVLNYYKKQDYSILCLQDTHFTPDIEPLIETQWVINVFLILLSQILGVSVFFLITILSLKYTMK